MAYSKCFNSQTLIVSFGNFPKKQNSDYLDIMTCDNWVFKMGKKDKNSDFMEMFSFLISNIFVELLVTHIKLYIYSERNSSALLKNVKSSHFKISHQNLKGFQTGKILKIANFDKV